MIPVILWKEYREQRATWLVLLALAAAVLVGLPVVFAADFDQRPDARQSLALVGVVLTWAYGMVCGGMLLAGEREARTQAFLDALPGGRGRLWVAKCLAGLTFVVAYALAVAALVVANALVTPADWPVGALVLPAAGLTGLGWGLYTSAFARTVLGAIGLSIALQLVFHQVEAVVGMVLGGLAGYLLADWMAGPGALLFALACLLFPLPFSALLYARVDRRRLRGEAVRSEFRRRLGATLWLAGRQVRGLAVWLLPLAFALGLLSVPQPLVLWPFFTLGLGAVCGVTCFLDEQAGPRQFLGEQRFPLGPVWGVKVGVRLLLLLASLVLAMTPLLVLLLIDLGSRAHDAGSHEPLSGRLFRSALVGLTVPPGVMLFAPALTGFAVGLVSGLVFRKAFIAVMAGAALALLALGVWVPGLLAGGVPGWQVFVVPVILLVAARLLMRPWTAGRLLTRRVVLAMIGLVVGCVALLGLGLWWRVGSVPDTPEPPDLAAMLARMPDDEHNEAGRLIRSTLGAIETRGKEWNAERPTKPLRPAEAPPEQKRSLSYSGQLGEVIQQGWPDRPMDQVELAAWLDRVFADEVWGRLDPLPALALGVVDDPRRIDSMYRYPYSEPARLAGDLLAARGLQMQKRGDPVAFVKNLEIVLALVRNLRNASPQYSANYARGIESRVLAAVDPWLAGLSGRPELLRRVGDALARHRGVTAPDRERDLAEYLVARNTLDDPAPWLRQVFDQGGRTGGGDWRRGVASGLVPETDALVFVYHIPWERERQERLLRRKLLGTEVSRKSVSLLMPHRIDDAWRDRLRQSRLTLIAATRIVVALRHHQATTGKPATDLEQLVPASIDAIPPDPYDGHPFRYRLSSGDDVVEGMPTPDADGVPRATTRKIPAGQGILWSVGPDRVDGGGRVFGHERGDVIYLVPPEKKD